jgi:hypothetical protein
MVLVSGATDREGCEREEMNRKQTIIGLASLGILLQTVSFGRYYGRHSLTGEILVGLGIFLNSMLIFCILYPKKPN